jgi:hypothetical protein
MELRGLNPRASDLDPACPHSLSLSNARDHHRQICRRRPPDPACQRLGRCLPDQPSPIAARQRSHVIGVGYCARRWQPPPNRRLPRLVPHPRLRPAYLPDHRDQCLIPDSTPVKHRPSSGHHPLVDVGTCRPYSPSSTAPPLPTADADAPHPLATPDAGAPPPPPCAPVSSPIVLSLALTPPRCLLPRCCRSRPNTAGKVPPLSSLSPSFSPSLSL